MSEQLMSMPIQLTTRGEVPREAATYALRRIEHVLGKEPGRVLNALVTLTMEANPALERPARIEVCFVVNGTPVRAHVAATELTEATDLVADRVRRRLVQLRERTRTRHRWIAVASDHEWRHGGAPVVPTVPTVPAPPSADQPVVRRKVFALQPMTSDEAAYELELLDHDFYLYADSAGTASVVYRRAEGGYAVLGPDAPELTLAQARERLAAGHERFVFYRDPEQHHGRVLYVRHDGRYGLLLPA